MYPAIDHFSGPKRGELMRLDELMGKITRIQNQLIILKEMRNHQGSPFVAAMLPKLTDQVTEDFDRLCEEWAKIREGSTPVLM